MKTCSDLLIWQKAMQLVTECYATLNLFPKEEQFGLTNQTRKYSVSIPSNIAEGYGRGSNKKYLPFLSIAISSLFEFQTKIEIALNLEYISEKQFNSIFESS